MVLYARGDPEKIRELRGQAEKAGLEIVLFSELPLRENLAISRRPTQTTLEGHTNLTPKELEILSIVADGLTNRAIAESLKISEQTVKDHLSDVYGKLHIAGYGSRAQAIAWYDENIRQHQ